MLPYVSHQFQFSRLRKKSKLNIARDPERIIFQFRNEQNPPSQIFATEGCSFRVGLREDLPIYIFDVNRCFMNRFIVLAVSLIRQFSAAPAKDWCCLKKQI